MEVFEHIVDFETENMRIDRYLRKICKNESMSSIYKALKKGDVRVNSEKIKENYRLSLKDIIHIKFLNVENLEKEKKYMNYDKKFFKNLIIYENDDFFIVNKPDNIPMHKGTGHTFGLSEIYKDIYENNNINFANRLDYETSGLVIGCKNMKFLRYISEKIRKGEVKKKYITVVHGKPRCSKFTIENYLETTKDRVKVYNEKTKNGKYSISKFFKINNMEIASNIRDKTILEVELITGRKHQIRVQLSNEKLPIIGDRKYGIKDGSKKFYLCCYYIKFDDYEIVLDTKFLFN